MEIRIGKATRHCARTQRAFEHGEEVLSLVRRDNEDLVREDYAKDAWEPQQGDGALAVWSTHYIDPDAAERQPDEAYSPLRQVFYEAAESDQRPDLARAYLAAQLLRRQKIFRLLKEAEEGEGESRLALFNDRIGDRLIEVRDPNFSYAELERARIALMERLSELESPEEPAEAIVESETPADA
jgi:hypothetical protein